MFNQTADLNRATRCRATLKNLSQSAYASAKERKNLLELLNAAGYEHGPSASLCIDAETGGNLVAFRSGAGDGSYGVYVGHDASGAV
ncbi:MAG: DUF4241 domain-containing protein, partial [Polyangiales bacterium]